MVTKKEFIAKQVLGSRFYKTAAQKARDISDNPELLDDLMDQVDKKARDKGRAVLGESWDSLMMFFRMIRAYAGGRYRKIPWKTLVGIVGTLVYFVMPFDVVPDIILGIGFMDDAALLLWTMRCFKQDMDAFAAWEREREPVPACDQAQTREQEQ